VTILATERTYLRRFTADDGDSLMGILGDAEAMAFSPMPLAADRSVAASLIARHLESYERHGIGAWAVILKASGRFIGQAGLIPHEMGTELFYSIVPAHWSRGFATEAACACRDYAFGALGERRIIAMIHPDHSRAIAVARRVGMTEVGMIRHWDRENRLFEILNVPGRPQDPSPAPGGPPGGRMPRPR
jgi:RimJ/RimL family protein N-acetyltransferase